MRKSKEIREEAWSLLWKSGNIWKLFGVGMLQSIIMIAVLVTLGWLTGFKKEAEMLVNLVGNLFQAVMALGMCAALLGVARGEEGDILSDSFFGYKYPFRAFFAQMVMGFCLVAWLIIPILILVGIIIKITHSVGEDPFTFIISMGLAELLIVILAITVSYRYRQLWFVKADDPSSGAFATVKASAKMMKGHKWELFKLDMSYWRPFTLLLLLMIVLLAPMGVLLDNGCFDNRVAIGLAAYVAIMYCATTVVCIYWALGSAIFYRDLKDETKEEDINA